MTWAEILVVWRSPEFQSVFQVFVWLCSVNAGFWIMARVVGAFLDIFSELFWESLWGVLAALYNIVLAMFFAGVLFATAVHGAPPQDVLWREMCGFILLYLALGAAYMDRRTHQLSDHTAAGYAVGLIVYLACAVYPPLSRHPELDEAVRLMRAVAVGWIGKTLTVFMVAGIAWSVVRGGLRGMFYYLSPALWRVGALKHPPIRIRRSESE